MSSITCQISESDQVSWADGEVTASPATLSLLSEHGHGWAPVTPEGPTVDLSTWRSDPWAFLALIQALDLIGTLTMSDDLEPIPAGPSG